LAKPSLFRILKLNKYEMVASSNHCLVIKSRFSPEVKNTGVWKKMARGIFDAGEINE
jgi:hypothetical protein